MEAFDVTVLHGAPRLDVHQVDLVFLSPAFVSIRSAPTRQSGDFIQNPSRDQCSGRGIPEVESGRRRRYCRAASGTMFSRVAQGELCD
jgi:hypothetical protein